VKEIEIFEIVDGSGAVVPAIPSLPIPPPGFQSRILAAFPALFVEFGEKPFDLLWRGSRDGFQVGDFHRRCDGHGNTLTLILDTNGNIFGGFSPAIWESYVGQTETAAKRQKRSQSDEFPLHTQKPEELAPDEISDAARPAERGYPG
jgi:hypothetical protein